MFAIGKREAISRTQKDPDFECGPSQATLAVLVIPKQRALFIRFLAAVLVPWADT
jgi:hypothetical protein